MAETLYKYLLNKPINRYFGHDIKWLERDDSDIFNNHLELCGQAKINKAMWDKMYDEETRYAGLFIEGKMIARACVEKYSDLYWEVGDVRVAQAYRNQGYAHEIGTFVMNYIVSQQKVPTMRTEEDNIKMRKVIEDLGFKAAEV